MPGPMNLDPAEVDALVRQGLMSPEQAQSFAPVASMPAPVSSGAPPIAAPLAATAAAPPAPPAPEGSPALPAGLAPADISAITKTAGQSAIDNQSLLNHLTPKEYDLAKKAATGTLVDDTPAGRDARSKPPEPGEAAAGGAPIGPSPSAVGGARIGGAAPAAVPTPGAGAAAAPNPNIIKYGAKDLLADNEAAGKQLFNSLEDAKNADAEAASAHDAAAWGERAATENWKTTDAEHAAGIQAYDAKARASIDAQTADLRARADAIKDVDPEHYWKSKGTAGRVGAAIAVALGAFGAALSHTQNSAQQIIQGAIDDDIKAQQSNIQNAWQKISKGTDLAKDTYARDLYVSDQMQKERLHALDKVKMTMAAQAATATSADVKAKYAAMSADIDKQKAAILQGQYQTRFQFAQQQAAAQAGGGGDAQYAKYFDEWNKQKPDDRGALLSKADWMRGRAGGGVPGGAGGGGAGMFGNVAKPDRENVEKDFSKRSEYLQTVGQLEALGKAATDPNKSVLERDRARALYNSGLVAAHEKFGAPGRSREAVEATVAPLVLNRNPLANDAERVGNVRKLMPEPSTPYLSEYERRGLVVPGAAAPSAPAIPGARPVAVSDARAKTNVRPARDDVWRFLDALHGSRRP